MLVKNIKGLNKEETLSWKLKVTQVSGLEVKTQQGHQFCYSVFFSYVYEKKSPNTVNDKQS